MNKKFLSAILFGALMVTSAGTFVSCKDYDDDIKDLQTQINKLATKEELSSQIATLDAALKAAAANAATAIQKAEGAEKAAAEAEAAAIAAVQEELAAAKAELEELVGAGLGTNTEALTAMNETVKAVEAKVTALVGEVSAMVTSVAIYETQTGVGLYSLDLYKYVKKEAVFGDKTEIKANETIEFKPGEIISSDDYTLIRVSPTNAVLKPENISLINSLGENLNAYVKVSKVEPYTELLRGSWNESRSASVNKSGLWKVYFELKEDADLTAFAKAVTVNEKRWVSRYDDEGNWIKNEYVDGESEVQFALAINNTTANEGEPRNVITGYNYLVRTGDNWVPYSLDFHVDGTGIWSIKNRWTRSEAGYNSAIAKVQEYVWDWNKTNIPAVAPTLKGEKINVIAKVDANGNVVNDFDNRQYERALPVVVGQPIEININGYYSNNVWYPYEKIAGFYVTLDKANALESVPSEINAWNSYEYENVGTDKQAATMFKGNTGTITIKNLNNVMGDVIGFRVYAVNLDGTLMDPDGRAFYVSVGDAAAETQTVSATITPKTTADNFVYVELTEAQKAVIASLEANKTSWSWSADVNNPTMKAQQTADPTFTVTFAKDTKGTVPTKAAEYNFAKFTMDAAVDQYINDKAYKMTMTYYKSMNGTNHELGKVVYDLTKTMPTAFPADFAFRPKQEVTDGSGKFIAYMIPENGYDAASEYGVKDLNNVFYGLNNDYVFKFGTSALNAKNEVVSTGNIVATPNAEYLYELKVAKKFIDNTEWHAVTVNYLYRGVSTTYDSEAKVYKVGQDHPVPYAGTLEAKYACWEDASAFDWGTYKQGTTTLSYKPALQWTAEGEGETANLKEIWSANSYNNDYFGLDLNELINVKGWLNVAADTDKVDAVKLVVNGQVDPYFEPTIEGGVIKFVQKNTQVDAAPTADHEETLIISVVDAYGHVYEITLPVTVKAPAKK